MTILCDRVGNELLRTSGGVPRIGDEIRLGDGRVFRAEDVSWHPVTRGMRAVVFCGEHTAGRTTRLIRAIREIREKTGLGLREAKDLAEAVRDLLEGR